MDTYENKVLLQSAKIREGSDVGLGLYEKNYAPYSVFNFFSINSINLRIYFGVWGCVCVCEREREGVCVWVRVRVCVCVCVDIGFRRLLNACWWSTAITFSTWIHFQVRQSHLDWFRLISIDWHIDCNKIKSLCQTNTMHLYSKVGTASKIAFTNLPFSEKYSSDFKFNLCMNLYFSRLFVVWLV